MAEKIFEKGTDRERIYLIAEDFETLSQKLATQKDFKVTDNYPNIRLTTVEASEFDFDELLNEGSNQLLDSAIIDKIEPVILDSLRVEVEDDLRLSTLVDLDPYDDEHIKFLEEIEGLVIEKEYPYLSSLYVTFPVKMLLKVAELDFIKAISDSKGEIQPTEEAEDGQG